MILYIGDTTYQDVAKPTTGKSDWGIDTLTRIMVGDRPGLDAYVASLNQGDAYVWNSITFNLQAWDPDDTDPVWGRVTLHYKGLKGGIPPPVVMNQIIEASGTSSHYWDPPYDWDTSGNHEPANSVTMDYQYYAGQTIYRYLTNGQNDLPTYGALGFGYIYRVKRVRITLNDGTVFGNTAPAGIATVVAPVLSIGPVDYKTQPIFGTPYFECEDTVRAELVGAS